MNYSFQLNWNNEDINTDSSTSFTRIGKLRSFIDENDCSRFELTVFEDAEQVITMPACSYWAGERHPTIKELVRPRGNTDY